MHSIRNITLRPLAVPVSLGLAACSSVSSGDQSTAAGSVIGPEIKK